jgi:hypothetical protein
MKQIFHPYEILSIADLTDANSYILWRLGPKGFDPNPESYREIERSWVNVRNRELVETRVANRGGRI